MIRKIPAKKIGMTSAFDDNGRTVPVTLVQPMRVVVTEIRRPETHGYSAVQLAYSETTAKHIRKPHQGILNKAGTDQLLRHLYETRQDARDFSGLEVGQLITPESVANWAEVRVSGTSKGKGFAGAVKRWGFAGQARTHGDPDNRRPQSNGATDPARVFKGSRRPGRMGNEKVSVKGLMVQSYNADLNLLAIKGSVPGPNGGLVWVTVTAEGAPKAQEQEA
ncbi:MAG: 50S ribosomal protein L3 [bacterium]|nr:50S ribosomal protein L3 [bacterium]